MNYVKIAIMDLDGAPLLELFAADENLRSADIAQAVKARIEGGDGGPFWVGDTVAEVDIVSKPVVWDAREVGRLSWEDGVLVEER